MADVRYTDAILDTFDRADELYPPGLLPPWYHTPGWDHPMHLESFGRIEPPSFDPNNQAMSSWRSTWVEDDCEVWGEIGGDAPLHEGWYWGLFNSAGQGYYIRNPHNVGTEPWEIYRRDDATIGGVPAGSTLLATSASYHLLFGGEYALIQLQGSTISAYYSLDAGANWTFMVSASDSNYRSFLYPSLGGQGGGVAWQSMGAGPIKRRTQSFRRLSLPLTTPQP